MTIRFFSTVLGVGLLLTSCGIDQQVHKKALDKLAACQAQTNKCGKGKAAAEAAAAKSAEQAVKNGEQAAKLQGDLDEQVRLHNQTRVELAGLTRNMQSTETELAELRKQREAAEKRAAAYRELTERMRALVDTGKLKVGFRKGQMVLELPSGILFASGKSTLSRKGEVALTEVTDALAEFKDRRFMIAGHTDNQKMKSKKFNNWHLSATRAVSIVEFFISQGFPPENLGAAGFGEFDPIADNETKEGRQQNRRLEIILVPDLSELPTLGTGAAG